MDLPAISHDGSPVLLDDSDVFSIRLLGRRIVITTVQNDEYYWPLSIEDVAMFFAEFEISDRKNVFNAEKIKRYDSGKGAVYSDEVVTDDSASVFLSDAKMREIKRKLGKEKDLANDWEY